MLNGIQMAKPPKRAIPTYLVILMEFCLLLGCIIEIVFLTNPSNTVIKNGLTAE